MTDFNTQIINEFRENGGEVGMLEGMPILLLHHVGAKSGTKRVAPLAYLEDNGRYAIFASKEGAPENPAWYHNLKANPDASIEVGDQKFEVVAHEPSPEERDRLYAAQSARRPQFAEYETRTTRKIPVIVLTRKD